MNSALIGTILLFISMGLIAFFLWWSRRIIRFIHRHDLHSAREIQKKLRDS